MTAPETDSIDLRSDTVTRPTRAMRAAMADADVGDDVYGEDPTVNRLEAMAARRLGMEAALFAPSGTQSNLLALLSHCRRGDEYLVGQTAHTYRYEAGGAAVLGSIQPQPIPFAPDGTLPLDRVARYIKPDDIHFARSRLLCLENTHNGLVLPLSYLNTVRGFADAHDLSLHLDGARLFNASIKTGRSVQQLAAPFDSVSICLSKGLGAPVGSLLCGRSEFIGRARRWRKMLGGGMRQAGILAAGGIHALTHHVNRLADDHANARRLADGLSQIPELPVEFAAAQTHMVFIPIGADTARRLAAYLADHRIAIHPGVPLRLVVHMGIDAAMVERIIAVVSDFFEHARHTD